MLRASDRLLPSITASHFPDRWIALSSLRKSIRRGSNEHAIAAAEALWSEPTRLLDRLLVIGLEDIGIGDLEVLREVIELTTDRTWRRNLPDKGKSATLGLVERMCAATKSRFSDELLAIAALEPALGPVRNDLMVASDKQLTPLDIDMLARIISVLPEDLAGVRDRALLLVGFFCALRRSELVALTVDDLDRRPDGWIITIQRSKTDPYGHGQRVALPALRRPLCPTAAIANWLAVSTIVEGPIFRTVGPNQEPTSTLSAPQVGVVLRQRAVEAGLAAIGLSAHSLRSGFAVSTTRAGVAAAQIQAVTRHRTFAGLAP